METLQQHLEGLLSADIETRNQAEAAFNAFWMDNEANAKKLLPFLCMALQSQYKIQIRSLAAILFRRMAFKPFSSNSFRGLMWNFLDASDQVQCQAMLLSALVGESEAAVKHKISDAVSELSKTLLFSKISWPQLLELLSAWLGPDGVSDADVICALRIVASCPEIFEKQQSVSIFQLLLKKLNPVLPPELLATAVDAVIAMYGYAPKKFVKSIMSEAVAHIWTILEKLDHDEFEKEVQDILGSLISLADYSPKLFKGILPAIFNRSIVMILNEDIDDIRHSYVELVTTLCERMPELCQKEGAFISAFVGALFKLLADLDDDDSQWHSVLENEPIDDDNENYAVAEQSLDRLSCALGGDSLASVFMSTIPSMVSAGNDWKQRHAGIMAIACIAEGCRDQFETCLSSILQLVFESCKDPHPRVRHAASHCLGQLCTDFSYTLQRDFHAAFFTHILPLIQDANAPRVQCHAIASLVNFCQDCEASFVAPYLPAMMPLLFKCLNSTRADLQEQAVTSLACIASVSQGEYFAPYYSLLMRPMIDLMKNLTGDRKIYRAKIIEAISMIASSVSKETLRGDVQAIIEAFLAIQESKLDDDDPAPEYLMSAWVRLCGVLQDEFHPLLPKVLPPLVAKANVEPDIAFVDDEEVESEEYAEGWEFVTMKGKRVGINTGLLDEKADALESIERYATLLTKHFASSVPQLLPLVLPLLKFELHERVRSAAASCCSTFLTCIKAAGGDPMTFWKNDISPSLLDAFTKQADPSAISTLLSAIYTCLDVIDNAEANFDAAFVEKFLKILQAQLVYLSNNVVSLKQSGTKREQEADDDEAEQYEADDDDNLTLLNEVTRCFYPVVRYGLSPDFVTSVAIPFYSQFVLSPAEFCESVQHDALCFFDDLFEFGKSLPAQSAAAILNYFASSLTSTDCDIVQAAAFGVGVMAGSINGQAYREFCVQAFPNLVRLLEALESKHRFKMACENILSAIIKIYSTFGGDLDLLLKALSMGLPIVQDESEMHVVYSFVANLLASKPAQLQQHGPALVKPLLRSIATISLQKKTDLLSVLVPPMHSWLSSFASRDLVSAAMASLELHERNAIIQIGLLN